MVALVGFVLVLSLRALLVTAQLFPVATQWCDNLTNICFWRHYISSLDTAWGYLFPPAGRNEFIGFFTAPNCTSWSGGSGGINLNGDHLFGFVTHAAIKPLTPSDPNSSLYQHTLSGQHILNTVNARSASYDTILSQLANAPPLTPGGGTPGPTPTTATTTQIPTPTGPLSCPGAPAPSYVMNVAPGWRVTPVLGRLRSPRGITMDSRGNLLVLQRGIGVTGHQVDANGCVTSSQTIIQDTRLNHGLDVVGNKLYASSSDIAWSWDYDPVAMTVSNMKVLVTGMFNPGHNTRTIHVSRKYPDFISLSVGSDSNIDVPSFQPAVGRSQIRVFDMRNLPANGAPYNSSYGKVFGYGLRNDVGIAEDRAGIVYSVENSLDNAYRTVNGVRRDIHNNNPAEKVYRLGNPTSPNENLFGGYPYCYTVWEETDIIDKSVRPGDWFVQDTGNSQYTDAWCEANSVKPIALLPPHTAPLDMKFGVRPDDTNLYVGLHGSWNRSPPQGYKVVIIPGRYSATGEWSPTVDLAQTKTSFTDLLTNRNENQCQGGCFRPVGLIFSANGENLYVSSDTSGEIFLLKGPGGSSPVEPTTSVPTSTPTTPTTTSTAPGPTQTLWGQWYV
ncbi:hypothetical protein CC1G_09499 [Coprinopsis cinerea okayama7|uniref:Pyrroloquinoline quinone-dependent pyranose dehydrogenase beta-propeller domain-containing protein n=1 Tax=Coprinopsis cinerea (strain Okayama-7 / 130 / ATCC MYA-4618 / FGSC 9003) TaxID=240176 RepID=A8P0R6_COPC7|nr:hypothetical protein CC1G_09499 [Coprinopsis cinerea okayama7\|eukprot:XP_001837948.2 hypothetical protein CC1G_09499 [Coprinopsis cinerea okayama7\